MAIKKILNKTKAKILLTLLLTGLLCFSVFFATACKDDDDTNSSTSTPTYTYVDVDDGVISNPDFIVGTVGTKLENYPKKTITGWTRSTTNSLTSDADSGVVDVTEDGWAEVLDNLYSESGILNYLKKYYGFTDSDVTQAIKDEKNDQSYKPTANDKKDYIVKKYYKDTQNGARFLNPGVHQGATDNKVYMLNNYASNEYGFGAAQSLKSSKAITLEKGQYGKITVWVKTANINGIYDAEKGANIRISSTINDTTQNDVGIFNIVANDWTPYTLYLKGDDVYPTTFTLILGLGYDYATEGTAYFDDIEFTELTSTEFQAETNGKTNLNTTAFTFTNKTDKAIKIEATDITNSNYVLYDVDFAQYVNTLTYKNDSTSIDEPYKNDLTFSNDYSNVNYYYYTKSGVDSVDGSLLGNASVTTAAIDDLKDAPYGITTGIKATLTNASYSIKLDNNGSNFAVAPETYTYVSFFVKNNLSKKSNTDFTVNVYDINGTVVETRKAVASFSTVSEDWVKCGIIVKNNFDATLFPNARHFYLEIVLGPTNVKLTNTIDFASGNVVITNPTFATGSINQYTDDTKTTETTNSPVYSFLTKSASGATALYAAGKDYVAESDNAQTYSLTVAPSDIGTILTKPAKAKDYIGVVPNHFYIKEETEGTTLEKDINANENAGIINSKYTYSATYGDVSTAIGELKKDENGDPIHIQPLMIYNPSADSYGFLSNAYNLPASTNAKISVSVRVVGANAKAYIYLVDTTEAEKTVMTFDSFTINTGSDANKTIEQKELFFEVNQEMTDENGWVTVEFYIANGATSRNFRLELWNGDRTGTNKSTGHVFFNDINVNLSNPFSVPESWQTAFSSGLFFDLDLTPNSFSELLMYQRELTTEELEYNSKQSDSSKDIAYKANYVWAETDTMIYAVYNTLDPVAIAVPDDLEEAQEDKSSCAEERDPSTFWLSFSSILLGVVLLFAIVMLFLKSFRRRKIANASDAKSHYKVTSRTAKSKKNNTKKLFKKEAEEVVEKTEDVEVDEQVTEETEAEEVVEETETAEASEEQTLDEFVYGDVQTFGDEE